MRTTYPLKQSQYAKIYQASERTVRTWMKKGAPLDDPAAMLEGFLCNQRSTPVAAQKLTELATLQASYQREVDPKVEQAAVRAEFGAQIVVADGQLTLARNFVRKYEPARWPEIVERLNGVMTELESILELAGIGEDYEWPEPTRADLAKPVMWNWLEDREGTNQAKA